MRWNLKSLTSFGIASELYAECEGIVFGYVVEKGREWKRKNPNYNYQVTFLSYFRFTMKKSYKLYIYIKLENDEIKNI